MFLIPFVQALDLDLGLDPAAIKLQSENAAKNVQFNSYFSDSGAKEMRSLIGYDGSSVDYEALEPGHAQILGNEKRSEDQMFSSSTLLERQNLMKEYGMAHGNAMKTEAYLDKALKTIKDTRNNFDFLTSSYKDCKDSGITTDRLEMCEQFYETNQNSCFVTQVVEIDPKYTYLCHKTREIKNKLCTESMSHMKCKESSKCELGAIVPGSLKTEMKWDYDKNTSILRIGTLGKFYLNCNDDCKKFIERVKFDIQHKEAIKSFRIKNLFLNNLLQISLNGHVVYNSLGGNKLETNGGSAHASVYAGKGIIGNCYTNDGKQEQDDVDIDLIPHLKDGENEIVIDLVYSFKGHIRIEIENKQSCCSSWADEEREVICDYS